MESIIVLIVPDCPIIEPSMVVVLDYRFEALMVRDPVFFLSLASTSDSLIIPSDRVVVHMAVETASG